jgi:putative tricarboxylic transport membrane protein
LRKSNNVGEAPRAVPPFWSRDRCAGLALVLMAGAIAWESRALPLGSLRNPGAAYWPLIIAVSLALFGAMMALRGGGPALAALHWPEARQSAIVLVAAALGAWAFERIGYRLTVLLVLVFFLGVIERRPPIAAAVVAFALSFGSFFLFADLLRVPLPRGPWGM